MIIVFLFLLFWLCVCIDAYEKPKDLIRIIVTLFLIYSTAHGI
jgi:hypothetical protein